MSKNVAPQSDPLRPLDDETRAAMQSPNVAAVLSQRVMQIIEHGRTAAHDDAQPLHHLPKLADHYLTQANHLLAQARMDSHTAAEYCSLPNRDTCDRAKQKMHRAAACLLAACDQIDRYLKGLE